MVLAVQVIFLLAVATAFAVSYREGLRPADRVLNVGGVVTFEHVPVPRTEPLRVTPLYDRPDLVSDENLAAVLEQLHPRFAREHLRPNYIEHALRTWGIDATFRDPQCMSGAEMAEFLTNNGRFLASWERGTPPLLEELPTGVAIRWGTTSGSSASVHHDHWLASLTEAGIHLDHPIYGVGRDGHTIDDVLQESLRDFHLDEREVEWSAMAFGYWIVPTREWIGDGGRHYSFDLLVDRLVRGDCQLGVCSGTHRLYSLMVLIRLDDDYDILTDEAREIAWSHLEDMRDRISASQWEDGRWPSNWPDGAAAAEDHIDEELFKQVIATGHHLEWLAIAPQELHPSEEHIQKAIDWCIATTLSKTHAEIEASYTFYSHIASALSLWRHTRPAEFWHAWEARLEPSLY